MRRGAYIEEEPVNESGPQSGAGAVGSACKGTESTERLRGRPELRTPTKGLGRQARDRETHPQVSGPR